MEPLTGSKIGIALMDGGYEHSQTMANNDNIYTNYDSPTQ